MPSCNHSRLRFDSIAWEDGYQEPTRETIQEALRVAKPGKKKPTTKTSGKSAGSGGHKAHAVATFPEHTFPAPLVECDDELYHDPEYPSQSVQEWQDGEHRNAVTTRRRTIYLVPPPEIADEVGFMRKWSAPQQPSVPSKRKAAASSANESSANDNKTDSPRLEDVAEYLRAFYHGLPVKILEKQPLRFVSWEEESSSKAEGSATGLVGLETSKEAIGIRCRASPDKVFLGQLNLNDMLDVAVAILPADAYALLMLVHHDLHEDDEDDFCCGRAYGGSRVAVVSTARYHPELDSRQSVDREHSWPASHCAVRSDGKAKKGRVPGGLDVAVLKNYPDSAVAAGIDAFSAVSPPASNAESSSLWFARVCKTASHELGHCFGIDHCTYFACMMQGTANIAEDTRQPPYLCPVDLSKVLKATGSDQREHYNALLTFCESRAGDRMFAAFGAWILMRLQQVDSQASPP